MISTLCHSHPIPLIVVFVRRICSTAKNAPAEITWFVICPRAIFLIALSPLPSKAGAANVQRMAPSTLAKTNGPKAGVFLFRLVSALAIAARK